MVVAKIQQIDTHKCLAPGKSLNKFQFLSLLFLLRFYEALMNVCLRKCNETTVTNSMIFVHIHTYNIILTIQHLAFHHFPLDVDILLRKSPDCDY